MSTCGTGTGNFPQPGDPNLNGSFLSAVAAFGGIDVSWTYPEVNPQAVAHTLLYRSTNANPDTMLKHRTVTGDYYFDKSTSDSPIEYFYWIQIVSVNGTVGDLIGPQSATARPTIGDVITGLTNRIDQGLLATSLKESIGEIDNNKQAIYDERIARAQNDDALGAAFSEVSAKSDDTQALLQQEINARTTNDSAFIEEVNTLATQVGEDVAAVQTDLGAWVDTVNGDLKDIGAKVSFKTDVNGLIGGFGMYNDGSRVEMGFDVDTFWIGRTGTDGIAKGRKPFIIKNDEVFINQAVIKSLTFGKLRNEDDSVAVTEPVYDELGNLITPAKLLADNIDVDNLSVAEAATFSGTVESSNFISGYSGFRLSADGTATSEINFPISFDSISGDLKSTNYNSFYERGWKLQQSGQATFYDVVISRPNVVADGVWSNPSTQPTFTKTFGSSDNDWGPSGIMIAEIDTGYDNFNAVRDVRGPALTARAWISAGHFWWYSDPGSALAFRPRVRAELVTRSDMFKTGASNAVPGGRILMKLYAQLPDDIHQYIYKLRIDKVEWALTETS